MALRILQQGVSKTIYPRNFGIRKAKEAWETFQKEFKGFDKVKIVRLQTLWMEFDSLMMKDNEKVQDFFSKVAKIINQIRNYGDVVEDKRVVQKILRSLPYKFDHIVAAILEAKDLSSLTLYELMGSLEAHEQRIN